jgi:hypothetical protein
MLARLDQIGGHRAAHIAKTDESDFRHMRFLERLAFP